MDVTKRISIPDSEIHIAYIRSSGPGGQNVNKLATAAQLRFDVKRSPSLSPEVKERLCCLAGRRMTDDGVLVIDARRYRTQFRNRQDAVDRLIALIRRATVAPPPRLKTRPTAASKRRRLEAKRRRSQIKTLRRRPIDED